MIDSTGLFITHTHPSKSKQKAEARSSRAQSKNSKRMFFASSCLVFFFSFFLLQVGGCGSQIKTITYKSKYQKQFKVSSESTNTHSPITTFHSNIKPRIPLLFPCCILPWQASKTHTAQKGLGMDLPTETSIGPEEFHLCSSHFKSSPS